MIRSYASEMGRNLFEGNWAPLTKQRSLGPLEDCFIDLRILDAAATESDIVRAFQNRLVKPSNGNTKGAYCVHEPPESSFSYRIEFTWTGNNVEAVDVMLSPPETGKRAR